MRDSGAEESVSKMRAAGLSEAVITCFRRAWEKAASAEAGLMPESGLQAVDGVPRWAEVVDPSPDPALLEKLCVIKLNGGLGTGMGLERAKSLIAVKKGLTFLDFMARQILWLRKTHRTSGPRFLLMDSFSTSEDTLAYLEQYPELSHGGELDFLQSKVPKLMVDTLAPVTWPADPELEWCPPGHGDLYPSLLGSGWLDGLAEEGIEYLFISNSDNLGASVDLGLLGYFAGSGLSFLMEVAERTASDRKGGHLARRKSDGRLVLREVAQCPENDQEAFQDITRHRFFNTNTLWLRLSDLRAALQENGGVLPLPLIQNTKTVDPRDASSPKVLQLESAMGAAIECFAQAGAVLVPRTRFAPVKATNDLLALRSDAYVVTEDERLELSAECGGVPPEISLDPRYYKLLAGLEESFGPKAPSLRQCRSLEVKGRWIFEDGVKCQGRVKFDSSDQGGTATAKSGSYADTTVEE